MNGLLQLESENSLYLVLEFHNLRCPETIVFLAELLTTGVEPHTPEDPEPVLSDHTNSQNIISGS